MKKVLLLAALVATGVGANAQTFGEIFEVSHEGQIVENGATIVCETYDDLYGGLMPGMVNLEAICDFNAKNINEEPYQLAYEFYRSVPSLEEVAGGAGGFGAYQACYSYSNPAAGIGNCTDGADGDVKYFEGLKEIGVGESLDMAFHQIGFTTLDPVTIHFTYFVIEGGEKLEGAQFDLNIKFTHQYDITNGVAGIDADAADAEYFNLLGTRVANPVKGQIYIVRQGGKTAKVIL